QLAARSRPRHAGAGSARARADARRRHRGVSEEPMTNARRRRLWIGLLLLAVLAWLAWYATARRAGRVVVAPAARDTVGAGVRAVRLYFASSDGDSLIAEPRELVESASFHDRVTMLVAELDRGPRGRGVAALPAGTSVLHAFLDERGLLTLDL